MKTLKEKNQELEEKILTLDTTGFQFDSIADGLINPDAYEKANIKIMWVLKEAYAQPEYNDYGGWSLSKALNDKKSWTDTDRSPRMANMIHISYGILNNFTMWNDMNNAQEDISVFSALKSISYINLKKIAGGKRSSDSEIEFHFQQTKDIVYAQIELMKPQVIIGGNTMKFLFKDMGITESNLKLYKEGYPKYYTTEDRIYIDSYHPTNMGTGLTGQKYCDSIIEIAKNWFDNKKMNTL